MEGMSGREAEKAVIGSILIDPESVVAAMETLTAAHFEDPFMGEAFDAARQLLDTGTPADIVTLSGALADRGYKAATDDVMEIASWSMTANILPVYMPMYAQRVARMSRIRDFTSSAPGKIQKLIENPDLDPVDVLSEWMGEVEQGYQANDPGPRRLDQMMQDVGELMEGKRAGTIVSDVTATPWQSLTSILGGGVRPGEVCIVAGRPGSGKTIAGAQMLFEASMYGTAIMFSAEMTYESVVQRMLACESGVPFAKINDPQLMSEDEHALVQSYMDGLSALPVYIDDLSGITTDQIMARAQALLREGTVSLLVFDYLELAGDDRGKGNEESRISGIAQSLRHVARRLNIPVVVLAQLSREVERRNPPIPKLSDLRSSGMIEQVADKVVMLYRPQYYVQQGMLEPNPDEEHLIEMYVHKNRNGESGKVSLQHDGPVFRISEPEEPYAQEAIF